MAELSTDNEADEMRPSTSHEVRSSESHIDYEVNLFDEGPVHNADLTDNEDDGIPLGASVSTTSVQVRLSDLTGKRKRSAGIVWPNTNNANNADDNLQQAKRGKSNLPPVAESHYKAARNAAARAARLEANSVMLQKYLGHTEHIAPLVMRIKATPAFGSDDPTVKREWLAVVQEAEKQLLQVQIRFLDQQRNRENCRATDALHKLNDLLRDNQQAYRDAEVAINTVQSRVDASENQKLRNDIHRNESVKMGLSLAPKTRGQRKTQPKTKPQDTQTRVIKQGRRRRLKGNSTARNGAQPDQTPRPGTSRQQTGQNTDRDLFRKFLSRMIQHM